MAEKRAKLAAALLRGERGSPHDIETVLGHFELIGYLARKDLIDRRLLWNDYSEAVQCYWLAVLPYVQQMRQRGKDPSFYEETELLSHELAAEELKRARVPRNSNDADRVAEFLKWETDRAHFFQKRNP